VVKDRRTLATCEYVVVYREKVSRSIKGLGVDECHTKAISPFNDKAAAEKLVNELKGRPSIASIDIIDGDTFRKTYKGGAYAAE
jgi:hypothetical protein